MAHYSVATAKDKLSSLIAKAEAGEEVIITRHGKPAVQLRIVPMAGDDPQAAHERLRRNRMARGPVSIASEELLRLEDEDLRY